MAKQFLAAVALVLVSCSPQVKEPPLRDVIGVLHVSVPQAKIHSAPGDNTPVITAYDAGETVSVLSKKGDWVEIRVGDGSGWVKSSEVAAAEPAAGTGTTPTPRFLTAPSSVYRTGAKGEIVLEADVSAGGQVLEVRTLSNTTGSNELERLNRDELKRAKFYPLVVGGTARPFVYEYRVTY